MNIFQALIKKYIGESTYKKNILIMVGGRIISQAIPILLTPLFARIYSPEEFGIFGVFWVIVSFTSMISNARYCLAVILPRDDQDAKKLVAISKIFTLIFTCIAAIFLIIFKSWVFRLLNAVILEDHLIEIILTALIVGLSEPVVYYGMRMKQYKTLAIGMIIQCLILVIVRISMGYLGHTETGLMISYLAGYLFAYPYQLFKLKLQNVFSKDSGVYKNLPRLVSKYINFPKFSLLGDTLGSLITGLPNLLLNKMFGTNFAGYYSMSDKVLGSPIFFITSSVGDVFKQEASLQYRDTGSCFEIFRKTGRTLFLVGIIPFALLFIFGPMLVPLIFGPGWDPIGLYIRFLCIMYFTRFVVSPLSYVVYIVEKQKYLIFFQILTLLALLIAFGIGYYKGDLYLGLGLWAILSVIANVIILLFSYNFAKRSRYEEDI